MITELHLPQADNFKSVANQVPGYSTFSHYLFFEALLHNYPSADSFLVLGAYHGRDMAMLLEIAHRNKRPFRLVGVDCFKDEACADWPLELKGKTWQEAGYGEAPSRTNTMQNLNNFPHDNMILVEDYDESYLSTTNRMFDFIYLDTSHDYGTVFRQLHQVRRIANTGAIICGDDYTGSLRWGVEQAVKQCFTGHQVWDGKIWYASVEDLR